MDSSLELDSLDTKSPLLKSDSGNCGVKNLQDEPKFHLNGCLPFPHQVAGHKHGVDKIGILQHPDGTVLKQLQPPPRGLRELQFYSEVFGEDSTDPCLRELQRFLPAYYGTWCLPEIPDGLYLKLEDVTQRFRKPCIMDVKIGQRSYDPYATPEKRQQQISKYPLMEEIGFLVLGMRVYQSSSDTYQSYDQHYGRNLVKATLVDGLARFFHNGEGLRKDAVTTSIRKVWDILRWFESQSRFHFYGSSLLFVYEGDERGKKKETSRTGRASGGLLENNNHAHTISDTCKPQIRGCGVACGLAVSHGDPNGGMNDTVEQKNPWISSDSQPGRHETNCHRSAEGRDSNQHSWETLQDDVEVRMIDFAHVFHSKTRDDCYLYGLKSLLLRLQQILEK
ncbi:hypothetical protein GJAV_G00241310 [Gymnothorax javanicus]|nr:hypothetical protein GJAV_G00241310 [Gymnothorax javanicus]